VSPAGFLIGWCGRGWGAISEPRPFGDIAAERCWGVEKEDTHAGETRGERHGGRDTGGLMKLLLFLFTTVPRHNAAALLPQFW